MSPVPDVEPGTQVQRTGTAVLSEEEGVELCAMLGIATPRRQTVGRREGIEALDIGVFGGDRVVVKVAGSEIAHKTEVGGVVVCAKTREAIERALGDLHGRFSEAPLSVHEFVPHDRQVGGELLLGVRGTHDYGPVLTLALGGVEAERLAVFEPLSIGAFGNWRRRLERVVSSHPLARFLGEPFRGRPPRIGTRELHALLARVLESAGRMFPPLNEFEINPLVVVDGRPTALDVLARRAGPGDPGMRSGAAGDRPVDKLERLLRPRTIAIAGVSRRRNPGRVILENVLAEGFPADRIWIVKSGVDQVCGCPAVATVADLPRQVDLLVLAVGAAAVPEMVEKTIEAQVAESIILIPGGLGEKPGSEQAVEKMRSLLRASRSSPWRGPVVNGGNCLGVRSLPGRYDTLFIPRSKLSWPRGGASGLALISQSGAFAVARASALSSLAPRYVVSVGNQIDLTVGDYLAFLAADGEATVFACYVEGFQPADGRRFLEAAEEITRSGRSVVLYRAGRTAAGIEAAVSHTAAVAGSYALTRQLAAQAGVLVADTIAEFEGLARTLTLLEGREWTGTRLGAMSNAGFESVGIADRLTTLRPARFSDETGDRLERLITGHRLESVVTVRNPLDVSPIFDDLSFVAAAEAIIEDPGVDVGVVGCVPLTPALQTLAAGKGHEENVDNDDSVAAGLIDLWRRTTKPWVAVVDGGRLYDRFADRLGASGIPVFRTIDQAVGVLEKCVAAKLRTGPAVDAND